MPEPREPGVYFGLPDTDYHADPSLGSSDIKRLGYNPSEYWWLSHMNPLKPEDDDSPAKAFGRALHAYVLEGPDAFRDRHAVEPSKDDYENLLVTAGDLRDWLKDIGEKTSGNKDELIDRVLEHDGHAQIWDQIVRSFKEHCAEDALQPISQKWWQEIRLSGAMILKNPNLKNAFTNGAPEVSVFWVEDGVPLKCRFDFLKLKAIVDLKSIRTMNDLQSFDKAVFRAIANYRYDISAAHYMRGRQKVPGFLSEGKVFGGPIPRDEWLAKLAGVDRFTFVWVFYKANGAPIAKGYEFPMGHTHYENACRDIDIALNVYRDCLEKFGSDMWVNTDPLHRIDKEDLPPWMGL